MAPRQGLRPKAGDPQGLHSRQARFARPREDALPLTSNPSPSLRPLRPELGIGGYGLYEIDMTSARFQPTPFHKQHVVSRLRQPQTVSDHDEGCAPFKALAQVGQDARFT